MLSKPFKPGEPGFVQTEDGEEHELAAATTKEMTAANPECLNSKIENLINLDDLSENAILHNLRIRFKASERLATCADARMLSCGVVHGMLIPSIRLHHPLNRALVPLPLTMLSRWTCARR